MPVLYLLWYSLEVVSGNLLRLGKVVILSQLYSKSIYKKLRKLSKFINNFKKWTRHPVSGFSTLFNCCTRVNKISKYIYFKYNKIYVTIGVIITKHILINTNLNAIVSNI